MSTTTFEAVTRGRVRRSRRRRAVLTTLGVAVAVMAVVSLMVGQTFYPPGDVLRVILGDTVPGASFTVGELRLPRTVLALATGLCFGMGGVTFQTMLRNPLASPDIIGISSAASAAAAFGIIVLGLGETGVSIFAIVGRARRGRPHLPAVVRGRGGRHPARADRHRHRRHAQQRHLVHPQPGRPVGTCRRRPAGSTAASTAPPGTRSFRC